MPTHELGVASKPHVPGVLITLVWRAFSFAYGTFGLGAFVLLAAFRKANFRRLDDRSRKELAAGTHTPVALTTVALF